MTLLQPCLQHLRLYGVELTNYKTLPRALSYGIGQDGPGRFLVQSDGNQVELNGNTWKAFPVDHTVSFNSVLEFDFRLMEEAEGHAICLDEDLNEDVEIKGAKRCFRLAGTQEDVWTEVWGLESPSIVEEFKSYRIELGTLIGALPHNQPYISWGARIKYLALVQDNDEDENSGLSSFRRIKLYHDLEVSFQITEVRIAS